MNERDVTRALAQHADDHRVVRELHRVRPHVTYEVRFEGRRAVCKLATDPPGDPVTEARILQFVGRETDLPVPRVLAVGEDPDHFVAAWHDGLPDGTAVDAARARAMGAGLARFHGETAGRFDVPGHLRDEGRLAVDARETWHAVVLDLVAGYRDWLAGADAPDEYAALAGEVYDALRARPDLFEGAGEPVLVHGNWLPDHVGVAGFAGCHRPPAGCPRSCAPRCPRDLRSLAVTRRRRRLAANQKSKISGDVAGTRRVPAARGTSSRAVADGRVTGVVDFEHALVGPGEYDLLRATLPLATNECPAVADAFREGYESVRSTSASDGPDGVEARRSAHRLVLSASYLQALYLQRGPLDDPADLAERADAIREHVRADLDRLPDA